MSLISSVKKFFRGDNYFNIIILLLLLWMVISILSIYSTKFVKKITIKEKYVKPSKKSKYRVIDDDGNNYEIADSVFLLEFNSADDYANLEVGKTYTVYGYWFRFPIMSWFPQIYKFE